MHLSTDALAAVCEDIAINGSWAHAAKVTEISESCLYSWLSKSRRAKQTNDTASPFHFRFRDVDAFFVDHVKRAKAECVQATVFLVMEQNRCGIVEEVRDPSTGYRLPKLSAEFLGVSDQEMVDQLLDPVRDRWEWRTDPTTGERIEPVWEQKVTQIPASLRAKILAGLAPQVFGEKAQIDHNVRGAVVHIIEPAKYIPRAQREQQQIVDAEFKELPAPQERPDIVALRARAAELMAQEGRVTAPSHPVKVFGRPDFDKPSKEDGADKDRGDRAPVGARQAMSPSPSQPQQQEIAPQPARPSYQRKPAYPDPHRYQFNDSRRGMSSEDDRKRSMGHTTRPRSPTR